MGIKAEKLAVVVRAPALRRLVRVAEENGCRALDAARAMAIFEDVMQVRSGNGCNVM